MKKLITILLFLFLLALPIGSAVTLDTSVYTLPKFVYDSTKGTASVTLALKSTQLKETGLLELQMSKSGFGLNAILGNIATCDSSKPYQKAQPYAFDQIGETLTITITNNEIPDGTYYPTLVHVTKCCSTGSCDALQPFGWGYPLTSATITFSSGVGGVCALDTKQCPDGSLVGRDSGNNCEFKACPTTSINFKLSNIKRISGVKELPSGAGADSPLLYSSYVFGQGEIFSITVKNIGTQSSAPTLEAFFISKNNPFVTNKESNLCISPLQSVLGRAGIETKQLSTCKGDKGAVYTLSSMNPNEEATFYIYVPYPRSQEQGGSPSEYTLAGNLNYNKEKQYFVDISLISGCDNPIFYDEIGGTLNYNINSQCTLGSSDANQTIIDNSVRQKTIKKEDIKQTTSTDLLKSVCSTDDVCQSNAKCVPLSTLIEDGDITEDKTKQNIQEIYSKITKTTGIVGGTIGGAGVGVALAGAIPSICGVSLATGILAIPICLTATTLGGAYLGGSLSSSISKLFTDLGDNNLKSLGYCVPKEETTTGKFTDFIESIGKSLNDAFGGKAKTKLDDTTMGYIILGIVGFFIMIAFTRK